MNRGEAFMVTIKLWLSSLALSLKGWWDCRWNNKHEEVTMEVAYGYGVSKCVRCNKGLRVIKTRV
jgi:hypothetical protein